jgi:hypothetical protein
MFLDPKPKTKLDIAIDAVLSDMAHHSPTTEEYGKLLERLKDLHKMKETEKPSRPSPDVVIQSGAYILGIGMILHHEEFNVITSKALNFVPRIR